jgi:natural product precursor
MKTKNFSKKLVLKKKTVANLNTGEMNDVKGGTGFFCQTDATCTFDCSDHYTCLSYMPCDDTLDVVACPYCTVTCPLIA